MSMNGCGSSPALADHGNDFAEHLQGGRAHHVAKQLDEVCVSRVGTDHKRLLPEAVEDRLTALDVGRGAPGNDEQLARLGGIRISEYRRGHVALSVPGVLAREQRRRRRADRAHRQMDRAGVQPRRQTVEVSVPAAEHDLVHGIVVRQHADDDLAVEQVSEYPLWV